jgi:tetratricopeptide (TPR) repeat protein
MSKRRILSILTPLIVFASVLAVMSVGRADQPAREQSDLATAKLPTGWRQGATGQSLANLRAELEQRPGDPVTLAQLGDAFLQRNRETGEGRYAKLAEAAFAESVELDPDNPIALAGAATMALIGHDFAGGLETARRAHRAAPDLAVTYLPLIDGLIETGDYDGAAREIENLLDLKPSVAAYSRLSYFEELHGNREAALRAMRLAAETALPGSEARAFAMALVGDLQFDAGRYGEAKRWYRRADRDFGGYVKAEAGLLNVAAAAGRVEAARKGYAELVDDRGLIEYSDELGRLEQIAGNTDAAVNRYAVISRLHARELAAGARADFGQVLFEADHGKPDFGVELGEELWRTSKSVTSADAYSWALFAAGDIERARAISRRAMRLGSDEPSFLYHAGAIAAAAGAERQARRLLGRVVEETPGFDPLFARDAARLLERLG